MYVCVYVSCSMRELRLRILQRCMCIYVYVYVSCMMGYCLRLLGRVCTCVHIGYACVHAHGVCECIRGLIWFGSLRKISWSYTRTHICTYTGQQDLYIDIHTQAQILSTLDGDFLTQIPHSKHLRAHTYMHTHIYKSKCTFETFWLGFLTQKMHTYTCMHANTHM